MRKFIVYFALMLLLTSCSIPSDPGLPTWETTLEFYVLNDVYKMTELAEEDSAIVIVESDGDSLLYIQQEEYEEQEIELDATDASTQEEEAEIGDIELPNADNVSGSLTLETFAESANLTLPDNGQSGILPSFDFDDVDITLEEVEEFQSVTIEVGSCTMAITNNMPITLGNHQESNPLVMELIHQDAAGDILILEHVFENDNLVGNSSTAEIVEFDLSGKTIYGDMILRISGGSRGTEGQNTVIDHYSTLLVEVDFSDNMTAISADAKIDEQSILDTVNLEVDSNGRYKLAYAELIQDNCFIDITIENRIDLDMNLIVEIPALTLDGELNHFYQEVLIPRSGGNGTGEIENIYIDLGGAILQQTGSELLENIPLYAEAHIDSTLDYRLVQSSDSFTVRAEMSALEFERVEGVIMQQEQENFEDTIELDIEYPYLEEGGQLDFTGDSQIVLDVDMQQTQLPLQLTVGIQGENSDGEIFQLRDLNTMEVPVITIPETNSFQLVFSNEDYNLNELISILPEEINFNIDVVVGNDVSSIVYQRGDVMQVDILFQSSLSIATDTWVIPKEDGEILITEEEVDLEQNQYDAFKSAELELYYVNTTGLSARGDVFIAASEANIEQNITDFENNEFDWLDVINIPQIFDTTESGERVATITVNKEDINYLLEEKTYIASRLKLSSDGEEAISGEVSLMAKLKVTVEVSNDLMEDEED